MYIPSLKEIFQQTFLLLSSACSKCILFKYTWRLLALSSRSVRLLLTACSCSVSGFIPALRREGESGWCSVSYLDFLSFLLFLFSFL